MKEWLLTYWWLIWMLVVGVVVAGIRRRSGESLLPWRQDPDRYSNRVVLGQLVIVVIGLVAIALALLVVKFL